MKGVGKQVIKALRILNEGRICTASQFAREMWPKSPHWIESYRCGPHASCRGRGMALAGGSFIQKLVHMGLVEWAWIRKYPNVIRLTDKGHEILKGANKHQEVREK